MNDRISPAVDVTIGGQTRIYHAFITTAPIALDGPSTLTLYESCFADVAGFAADPIPFDRVLGKTSARLVLIGSTELVGLNPLQHWLWQRLAIPSIGEVH